VANEKIGSTSSRYNKSGTEYRDNLGVMRRTLSRRRAGWEHILCVHEQRPDARVTQ
jgi:hypothetical protein